MTSATGSIPALPSGAGGDPPAAIAVTGAPDATSGDGAGAAQGAATSGPRLLLHTIFSLALFLALVALVALLFRGEAEAIGRLLGRRLGVAGLALGTFLADALCFPVPPQVYVLTAHLSRTSPLWALLSISAASVIAGHSAYHLGRAAAALPRLRDLGPLRRARERAGALQRGRGVLAALLAAASPVPYSWLCYAAGACRLRYGLFTAYTLLRPPRILIYYLLIRMGWG